MQAETLYFILEIIGTIAFSISGTMVGIDKKMDVFGCLILGLTTAVGGGIIRDVVLGLTPPRIFYNPLLLALATISSILVMLVFISRKEDLNKYFRKEYKEILVISDAVGLGIFTVLGMKLAVESGHSQAYFLILFVGVLTGCGGGVLRDLMANQIPQIFTRNVYAVSSIIGGIVYIIIGRVVGYSHLGMIIGVVTVVVIRLFAAYKRWNLPSFEKHNQQ